MKTNAKIAARRTTAQLRRNSAIACCGVLSLTTAAVLADRGRGSIRAAGRPEAPPARVAPRAEPPHPAPEVHREAPRVEEPRRVDPPAHVEAPRRVETPVRRDWDDNDENTHHFGGFAPNAGERYHRGERVHDLPARHFQVEFNHHNYFWDDFGIYYEVQPDGQYLVVQPPVGVVVAEPPQGLIPIAVGPTTYEYLDGVFYIQQGNGLVVVNPPPGIVVPTVPTGATQVIVNGTVVYQFNGFNYTPSIQGGVTVYTVTPA
jgi:hypothetical protein